MGQQITESRALWALIAAVTGVDAMWAWAIGIPVVPSPMILPLAGIMVLIGLFYTIYRPEPKIAAAAEAAAQLIVFSSATLLLSYLVAATSTFPLIDRQLASLDAALGFDWLSLFTWVGQHPAVNVLFTQTYPTSLFQIMIPIVLLPALGRIDRLREFLWVFVISSLTVVALSWFTPAAGAWTYYKVAHLTNAYYVADFNSIRAHQMPEIVMDQITGIIQFPSFHASTALLLIYIYRGIPYAFPASLAINVIMLASTPFCGGHHVSDVLAGTMVTPAVIFAFRIVATRNGLMPSSTSQRHEFG